MVITKTKYSTVGVLVLFLGLFSVLSVSDSVFAQGSNQSAGNQIGGNRTAGNQTGEAMQSAGNQTGAAVNQTGEALRGAQEFFNEGGQNQGQ
jgi:hypothetical protein